MKVLFPIILVFFITSALAQPARNTPATPMTDQPSVDKEKAPKLPVDEKQEEQSLDDPFHPGPYKDGQYQFWGKDDQIKRDKREEANQ